MSPSKIASLLIAIFTIFLVMILATRESGVERMRTHLVGEIAPPVSGMTIEDDFWSLDNQKGRWVLVNFFSTTCIPCLEEHPELVSFSESQSVNNDVRIVSVAFDDDASSVASFFDENGGGWPVLADDTSRIAVDWGVIAVPESYLVSPAGFVSAKIVGGIKRAEIENLLLRAKRKSDEKP